MAEERTLVEAALSGDENAFGRLAAKYRPELQLHCYRMLGSFHDSEDMVQETLLRAWRRRDGFQGRSTFRAWLYKIATNVCLDLLSRRTRRPVTHEAPVHRPPPPVSVPWLEPYPDTLLDRALSADAGPDEVAVQRETVSLAFLAAIQHLLPLQRAVLILRDVLGWPARDVASALDTTVAAVNSALQRARPALRRWLPPDRLDWRSARVPSDAENAVLERYLDALQRADDQALARILADEARSGHQAGAGGHRGREPVWYEGRGTLIDAWAPVLHGQHALDFRFLRLEVNRAPAFATYTRPRGGSGDFHAFVVNVLEIEAGRVVEITAFLPGLVDVYGLPRSLSAVGHP